MQTNRLGWATPPTEPARGAAAHLNVACGEDALHAGRGAVGRGDDVAGLVQLQLAAEEAGGGLVAWGGARGAGRA